MKKIRILALLLALLTLGSLFVSCKKDPEPEDPTADDPKEEVVTLKLITSGSAKYSIVCDYKAGASVIDACNTLRDAIRDVIGAEITVKQCYSDRVVESDVETDKEILIGMTNRKESVDALSHLRSGDWLLDISGSKLVIGSSSDAGTVTAVTEFLNAFVYEQGSRSGVRNGEKYSLTFSSTDKKSGTASYSYKKCEMLDARIDSFVLIYAAADSTGEGAKLASNLRTYISTEAGYELDAYKDTRCHADYEILIGNTIRSDAGKAAELQPNEYRIELTAKKDADGKIVGGTMSILYGANAANTALNAFKKQILPAKTEPEDINIADGLVITNVK